MFKVLKLPIFHYSNAQTNLICIHAFFSNFISIGPNSWTMFWRPGDQYKHEMWVKTVLSCCLKSLWWYYWICFASKLYGKQIYQHIKERVLKGWMLSWTLLKCTVTREYKVRGCGCYSGSGSPAFCKGSSEHESG